MKGFNDNGRISVIAKESAIKFSVVKGKVFGVKVAPA
jgi:hypothetical protein